MRSLLRLLSLFLSLTLILPSPALAMRNLSPTESGLEEDLSASLSRPSPAAGLEEDREQVLRRLQGMGQVTMLLLDGWKRLPSRSSVPFNQFVRQVVGENEEIEKLMKIHDITPTAIYRFLFGSDQPPEGWFLREDDAVRFPEWSKRLFGAIRMQLEADGPMDDGAIIERVTSQMHGLPDDSLPRWVTAVELVRRAKQSVGLPAAGLEEVSQEEAARVLGILDAHFKKEGRFRPDNSKVQLMPYGFSNRVYRIERSDGQVLVGFKMQPILRFPALDRNHFRFEQKQSVALGAGVLPNNWRRLSFLDRREVKSKFYRDEKGDYWRFMPYVEERVIQTSDEIPADRRLAAMKRFGKLLVQFRQMTEMEVGGTFEDTLPNHQNATYHLDFYDRALAGENVDPPMSEPGVLPLVSIQRDRLEGSDEHGDFAVRNRAFQEKVARYRTILGSAMGRLRRVVVHGDPRMNNIFWEINEAGEWIPAALGDLDYLQSGHELLDLSDAVRSLAFMGAERADPENLVIFRDVVEALIEGWLEGIEAAYGKEERKRLESFVYLSVPAIHFTLAIRFYDSFLTGDSHFERLTRYGKKVSDPGRFLRFAEVQMAQAEAFMREFSDKPGMAELAQWAGGLEELPAVLDADALDTLAASRQLIFFGVHPDDIEQQLGGLVRQMAARGAPMALGVLTTGAGIGMGDYAGTEVGVRAEFMRQIHGWSADRTVTLEEKEAQRQQEAREGARRLGVAPEVVTFFRFGAGDTRTESLDETLGDAARQRLVEFLTRRQAEGARPLTVVYHDAQSDPHPAHFKSAEFLNAALRQAAEQMGQPIDVWAGGLKAEDGRATQRLPLTEADQEAKRQALSSHQTQVLHYEAKRRESGAETMHEWMARVGAASEVERQQLPPEASFVERYQRIEIAPTTGLEKYSKLDVLVGEAFPTGTFYLPIAGRVSGGEWTISSDSYRWILSWQHIPSRKGIEGVVEMHLTVRLEPRQTVSGGEAPRFDYNQLADVGKYRFRLRHPGVTELAFQALEVEPSYDSWESGGYEEGRRFSEGKHQMELNQDAVFEQQGVFLEVDPKPSIISVPFRAAEAADQIPPVSKLPQGFLPSPKPTDSEGAPPSAGMEEGVRWETAGTLQALDDASAKELAGEVAAAGAAGVVLLPKALVESARPEQLQIDVYGHESVEYDALMALGVSIVDTPYQYLPQVADQAREKIAGIKPGQPAVVAMDTAFEGSLGNILPEEYPLTLLIEPDSWQPNALRQRALAALITQAALHPQDRRLRNLIVKLTSDTARAFTLQGTEYVAVLISA